MARTTYLLKRPIDGASEFWDGQTGATTLAARDSALPTALAFTRRNICVKSDSQPLANLQSFWFDITSQSTFLSFPFLRHHNKEIKYKLKIKLIYSINTVACDESDPAS